MANAWQYKTSAGGTWASVPQAAREGTAEQAAALLVWPRATAVTPTNRPCGAVGKPQIVIRSRAMSGAGVAWWEALCGSSQSVQFWLTALNPRTNVWEQWTGYLHRPQVGEGVTVAGSNAVYSEILILVTECVAA